MKIHQLTEILGTLDKNKRIKFQNREGWKDQTMAINAILEEGNAYIFIWTAHPHLIKERITDRQKLIWYNPNIGNSNLVKEYFPEYVG